MPASARVLTVVVIAAAVLGAACTSDEPRSRSSDGDGPAATASTTTTTLAPLPTDPIAGAVMSEAEAPTGFVVGSVAAGEIFTAAFATSGSVASGGLCPGFALPAVPAYQFLAPEHLAGVLMATVDSAAYLSYVVARDREVANDLSEMFDPIRYCTERIPTFEDGTRSYAMAALPSVGVRSARGGGYREVISDPGAGTVLFVLRYVIVAGACVGDLGLVAQTADLAAYDLPEATARALVERLVAIPGCNNRTS